MKKTFKTHLLSALIVCLACPVFTGCDDNGDLRYGSRYGGPSWELFLKTFVFFRFVDNNSEFYLRYNQELSKPLSYYYVFDTGLGFYTTKRWEVVSDLQFTLDIFQTTEDDNWENPDNWKKIDMNFDVEGLPDKEAAVWHSDYSPFRKWTVSATFPKGHFILKSRLSYKHYPNAVIDENYNIVSLGEAVLYDSANKESIDQYSYGGSDFWTVLVPIYDQPFYF